MTALRTYSGEKIKEKSEVRTYQNPQSSAYNRMSSNIPDHKPRRGLGISAWGIVFVILAMIFAGVCVYYFSMCYPILCKKERKYDKIEISTV